MSQDKGAANLAAFRAWALGKSDDDFREYVRGGKLNRKEIAEECGFGKSALGQNASIKQELKELENGLREQGVLPPLGDGPEAKRPAQRDTEAPQRRRDQQRLNSLEQQLAATKAKLAAAEAKLKEYAIYDEFLADTGRAPR